VQFGLTAQAARRMNSGWLARTLRGSPAGGLSAAPLGGKVDDRMKGLQMNKRKPAYGGLVVIGLAFLPLAIVVNPAFW